MEALLNRFNPRDFGIVLTLVGAAISLLAFSFLVLPEMKAFRAITISENILQGSALAAVDHSAALAALESDVTALHRNLHGDMATLPTQEIEAFIVGKLQQLSWRNSVELGGVEPSVGETIDAYVELQFRVKLSGDYFDMYSWLRDVRDELGFVLIKEYEMQPLDATATNPRLGVNLVIATYRAT